MKLSLTVLRLTGVAQGMLAQIALVVLLSAALTDGTVTTGCSDCPKNMASFCSVCSLYVLCCAWLALDVIFAFCEILFLLF